MTNGTASKAIVGIIITLLIALLGASIKNAIDIATIKAEWRHTEADIHAIEKVLDIPVRTNPSEPSHD